MKAWVDLTFKYFGWNCAHSDSHLQGEDTVDEEAIANYCMMYSEFLVPDNYLVWYFISPNIDKVSTPRGIAPVTPTQAPLSTTATICGSHSFSLSRCLNIKHETFLLDHLISGQAILFYIPRCIWLGMEGGMMEFLVTGCTGRVVERAGEKQRSGHSVL